MHAAVVTAFDKPPTYREVPTPTPQTPDEILIDVIAAGLHPRVRSQADGSHYTSSGDLPLVPGIDGVGRAPDGTLRYFVLPDTKMGAMAEQTVIDQRRSVTLPDDADSVLVAAAMNPMMSSWIALRRRIHFEPGQTVLVLGATGSSGRMAVQVAKRLGASHVIGAGRDPERLAALTELGADATVRLDDAPGAASDLAEAASDVDIVVDYLWGRPRPAPWLPSWSTAPTPGSPLPGSRSVLSRVAPPRYRPQRCAPRACRSWAADRALCRPATSWPNYPPSPPNSPVALSMSTPVPCRSPRSKPHGTTPSNGSSSRPSSPRHPQIRPWPAQRAGHGSGYRIDCS